MALVGGYVALSKPLAAALPVFLLAWLRFGIGGIAMARWLKKPAAEAPLALRTRRLLFLESFLGNFLFTICMLLGVSMTSAVSAGVIMSAIPAAVAVMSWIFLRERIALRVWLGAACAVAGIALLSLVKHPAGHGGAALSSTPGHAWLGNLLLVGAVLCEASYAVIGKQLTGALSPKRIAALINLWGFALMTPMGLYLATWFDFRSVHGGVWGLLVFYALAASVWTVWLWMTGLRSVPAAQSGVFTVMLPISAALVGVVALGESLSGAQMAAFAVALVGIVLATLPTRNATQQTA
ncbi:DMT family transporter [Ramlibacter sp. H39-3-26]|uniref:DMT family transporter n=1 Tax=Curvibacter soli TaxID=3031331 RepID=UPI0023DA5857|nr:DMT family transporter [Ramlibacter sp. H39-3-26]MDF1483676.1 DMT family transporter [Ramlibacter sp. H39-3-26]